MKLAGIVLAGGASRRMGQSKALLPFGAETMLQRVVRLLHTVVSPVVVAAGPDQTLPPLPPEVRVITDDRPGSGPMAGMLGGMRPLAGQADAAYLCGCDVPLLEPRFVAAVAERLGSGWIAVPVVEGQYEPLAAVYRLEVLPAAQRLVADGKLSFLSLYREVPIRTIGVEELRTVDPTLGSLLNINTPEHHARALREAGL